MYDAQDEELFLEDGGIIVDYHGSQVYVSESNDGQYSPTDFMMMVFKKDCHSNLSEFEDLFEIEFEDMLAVIVDEESQYTPEELIGNAFPVMTSDNLMTAED